jgi:dynein heavy chain
MIDKKFVTIQGDVLLGAAFITYLSALTQKYREKSVEIWGNIIRRHGISISDDFSFNKTFGDQIKIKEWTFNGLPGDAFSIQNAVILEKSPK